MLKIVVLCLMLLFSSVYAKPVQIGYTFSQDLTFPIAFMLEDKNKLRGVDFYDSSQVLEFIGSINPTLLINQAKLDSLSEQVEAFAKGDAAIVLEGTDKAVYMDIGKRKPSSSVVWKYLNLSEIEYAIGFANMEAIQLNHNHVDRLCSLLKQNEKIRYPDDYDFCRDFGLELFDIGDESIVIFATSSEPKAMIQVTRDDQEAIAVGDFIRDRFSQLVFSGWN